MRRLLMFCLAGIAILAIGATPALAGNGKKPKKNYTYKITVTNLTTTQPLAPPVAAVHTKFAKIWQRGKVASHAVAAVAEDANNQILVDAGSKLKGVKSIVSATDAPIGPGESATFEVVAKGKYNRLSLISMLVKTNDAFTGVNSVRLNRGKTIRVFNKRAYDAGSEANNQLSSHIPGLDKPPTCSGPHAPSGCPKRYEGLGNDGLDTDEEIGPGLWPCPYGRILSLPLPP